MIRRLRHATISSAMLAYVDTFIIAGARLFRAAMLRRICAATCRQLLRQAATPPCCRLLMS